MSDLEVVDKEVDSVDSAYHKKIEEALSRIELTGHVVLEGKGGPVGDTSTVAIKGIGFGVLSFGKKYFFALFKGMKGAEVVQVHLPDGVTGKEVVGALREGSVLPAREPPTTELAAQQADPEIPVAVALLPVLVGTGDESTAVNVAKPLIVNKEALLTGQPVRKESSLVGAMRQQRLIWAQRLRDSTGFVRKRRR